MKRVIYMSDNKEVKMGDIVDITQDIKITAEGNATVKISQRLIDNNPDLFKVEDVSMCYKCVNNNENFDKQEFSNKKLNTEVPIDNVTTERLNIALKILGISLDYCLIDKIIDLVELIENKGGNTNIDDIINLQEEWGRYLKYNEK